MSQLSSSALLPPFSWVSFKDFGTHSHVQPTTKATFCPIYGQISFPLRFWRLIDTSHFQRLRRLKQLSICDFVYPGATHTRFEHCVGTGYLANLVVKKCLTSFNSSKPLKSIIAQDPYNPNSPFSQEDTFLTDAVTAAGLLHDIGHGPFSHTFELVVQEMGLAFNHERFAEDIIEDMVDEYGIDIDEEMRRLVASLITGDHRFKGENYEYKFLYQIVANKSNSIDVDKFDYIYRDCYATGVRTFNPDFQRIYNEIEIIDGKICFSDKMVSNIEELFEARYEMFRNVYHHDKNICLDSMIKDALVLANDYLHLEEKIKNPKEFIKCHDGIIDDILNIYENEEGNEEILNNPKIKQAQKIIMNLYSRNIYKFIGKIKIPNGIEYEINIGDFLDYNNPNNLIRPEDIELSRISINYGFGSRNPFSSIYFYNENNLSSCFLNEQNMSLLKPRHYHEAYIHVLCKEANKAEKVREMFEEYRTRLNKMWGYAEKDDKKDNNEYKEKENKRDICENKETYKAKANTKHLGLKRNRDKYIHISNFSKF